MNSREAIFAALFAQLSAAPMPAAFATISRALRHWADVQPSEQPALFQCEGRQTITRTPRLPNKQVLAAELYVYVHKANIPDGILVSALNAAVDAVFAALEPAPAFETQTLGGLVTDCRIVGDVETDEGRLGDLAVAIIPVEIIANV